MALDLDHESFWMDTNFNVAVQRPAFECAKKFEKKLKKFEELALPTLSE